MGKTFVSLLIIMASSCGFDNNSSKLNPSSWPNIQYKSKIAASTFQCLGNGLPRRNIVTAYFKSAEAAEAAARQACADEANKTCGEYAPLYVNQCKRAFNITETIVTNMDDSESPTDQFTCETKVSSSGSRFTTVKHGRSKVSCEDACGQNVRYANTSRFKKSFDDYYFPWSLESTCVNFKGTVIDISSDRITR